MRTTCFLLPEIAPAGLCPAPDQNLLGRGVHDQGHHAPLLPLLLLGALGLPLGEEGESAPLYHHLQPPLRARQE